VIVVRVPDQQFPILALAIFWIVKRYLLRIVEAGLRSVVILLKLHAV
jgi:hypothetical protein